MGEPSRKLYYLEPGDSAIEVDDLQCHCGKKPVLKNEYSIVCGRITFHGKLTCPVCGFSLAMGDPRELEKQWNFYCVEHSREFIESQGVQSET